MVQVYYKTVSLTIQGSIGLTEKQVGNPGCTIVTLMEEFKRGVVHTYIRTYVHTYVHTYICTSQIQYHTICNILIHFHEQHKTGGLEILSYDKMK
jgi:hypothetical protein